MAKPNLFKVAHQNIQGFASKENEIELFLDNLNVDIFCVTEHWFKNHQLNLYNNELYSIGSSFTRKKAIHGGSLILLRNHFEFKNRLDIVGLSVERNVELSCVEVDRYIIVCVYRPPSACFDNFENIMEKTLNCITRKNGLIIVCGDFNVNLLEDTALTTRLMSLINCYNLRPQFLEPTRVDKQSASCLDNIFCNFEVKTKLNSDFLGSDHFGQIVGINKSLDPASGEMVCRPINKLRRDKFRKAISEKLPFLKFHDKNPNHMYKTLFRCVKTESDKIFTIKKIRVNDKLNFCDWASPGIYKSRKVLYELYKLKRDNVNNPSFIDHIKQYSKIFKKVCKIAKSLHLKKKIIQSDNKIKATWKVVNTVTGKYKSKAL